MSFNFVSNLRLAIKLNSNQTVKILLRKIFEIKSDRYKELLMLEFPKLLKSPKLNWMVPFIGRESKLVDEMIKTLTKAYDKDLKADSCTLE